MLYLMTALSAGVGMPMQTSINAQLGRRVGSPFLAALINFTVGITLLLIAALFMEGSLAIPFGNIKGEPLWVITGGAFAAFFVAGNILLMPKVGSIQTAILPASGQIIMGTIIDTFGLFNATAKALSPFRALGIVLVFAGVVIVILSKNRNAAKIEKTENIWAWRAFGIIVGCAMACQTAINANLGLVLESRIYAAIVNFIVGLVILITANVILLILKKNNGNSLEGKTPKWILCGGMIGAWYCIANIISAQVVGTGMCVIMVLTGLMAGGLLVDQFGMFRAKQRPVRAVEILGVIVMVAGAAMFHLL